MKLNYAALISPHPFLMEKVGSVKSPTLREIWSPDVGYQKYQMYLTLLFMTPQVYFEQAGLPVSTWYQELPDEEKQSINMMDLIAIDENLQQTYAEMLAFFFLESIVWDKGMRSFFTYNDTDQNGQIIPVGIIYHNNYVEVCDIILQRCGIARTDTDTDTSKVKSKRALEILKKLQAGRQNASRNTKLNKDMELPNLITAVAVKSNSINFTNIWDLTIYQLYEQFKKEQTNVYFDIQKMAVAAYGNEKNTFKGTEWYQTEN